MQTDHTPTAGEDASLSRRNFITIAAASTAATLPAVALAGASGKTGRLPQSPENDPLLLMIQAYLAGMAAFNRTPDFGNDDDVEQATINATYGLPYRALQAWDEPALTYASAVAAIRLAFQEEEECGSSPLTVAMLNAALRWFDHGLDALDWRRDFPDLDLHADNCLAQLWSVVPALGRGVE